MNFRAKLHFSYFLSSFGRKRRSLDFGLVDFGLERTRFIIMRDLNFYFYSYNYISRN